jgi:hypothetical protein
MTQEIQGPGTALVCSGALGHESYLEKLPAGNGASTLTLCSAICTELLVRQMGRGLFDE